MRAQRRASAGFTLLEVLVAVAVLGLVLAGLTQGVRYGMRSWSAEARVIDEHEGLDAADRTLRQLIGSAGLAAATHGLPFKGQADRLEMVPELPEAAALASPRVEAILLVNQDHRLVLRWIPHRHGVALVAPAKSVETVLLDSVESMVIGYHRLPAQPNKSPNEWGSTWANAGVPDLIRVHLDFAKGDPRRWPDIVIAGTMK